MQMALSSLVVFVLELVSAWRLQHEREQVRNCHLSVSYLGPSEIKGAFVGTFSKEVNRFVLYPFVKAFQIAAKGKLSNNIGIVQGFLCDQKELP